MWLNICQGLVLLGWVWRICLGVIRASIGQKETEPLGMLGIFLTIVWAVISAAVIIRSGAINTIVGYP